jgi:general secretion pathway protein N
MVGTALALALVNAAAQELPRDQQAANTLRTDEPPSSGSIPGRPNTGLGDAFGSSPAMQMGQVSPINGNPLWTIPKSSLAATRERPIFSPSRRQPPAPFQPPVQLRTAPVIAQPSRPLLTLVGAIAGEGEGDSIAIFVEDATKATIRLKAGESYLGWVLRLVRSRQATLENERQTAVLDLSVSPSK